MVPPGGYSPPLHAVVGCLAREVEQPFIARREDGTAFGIDVTRLDIAMDAADRAALFLPERPEIVDRPAGDRAREVGGAIVAADRDAIFVDKGIDEEIGRASRRERVCQYV